MKTIDDALSAGLAYILGTQNKNGSWLDFYLLPGPSDIWVTAYVGYSLTQVAKVVSENRLRESLSRARDWIASSMNADFGWGYNKKTDTDADSTAYSINFLASLGESVDNRSFTRLRGFQKGDGGFCTYLLTDEGHSWGDSHPDVTPVALLALLNKLEADDEIIVRGARSVLKNRGADGFWQSFWFDTPLYSTAVNLKFLDKIGKRIEATKFNLSHIETMSGFELSLAGECLIMIHDPDAKSLLDSVSSRLGSLQQPDGSWKEAPILRVTSTNSHRPWVEANSGNLYPDWNRVFTTGTALRFLAGYKQLSN